MLLFFEPQSLGGRRPSQGFLRGDGKLFIDYGSRSWNALPCVFTSKRYPVGTDTRHVDLEDAGRPWFLIQGPGSWTKRSCRDYTYDATRLSIISKINTFHKRSAQQIESLTLDIWEYLLDKIWIGIAIIFNGRTDQLGKIDLLNAETVHGSLERQCDDTVQWKKVLRACRFLIGEGAIDNTSTDKA